MKRLAWTFAAGFLMVTVSFAVVSLLVMDGLDEPIPGWLSDRGGP
ncbi:hypothetical protein RM572_19695 [Streptomyces sp. DSM 42041]|uniref:Uncharacterized protein n=1 Tax=Streptomyces hazeniae TaxID=3075538 RepID=A0ABU2NVH3_9ACTN|nr:hypothetical protein [Streptomyces sp. DSM 42041]MDT0380983.1 hypothetical protein [Streptomyces sp. DSM 42041]